MERHLIIFDDAYAPEEVLLLYVGEELTNKLIRMRNCIKLLKNPELKMISELIVIRKALCVDHKMLTQAYHISTLSKLMVENKDVFDSMDASSILVPKAQINMNSRFEIQIERTAAPTFKTYWYSLEEILGRQIVDEPSMFQKILNAFAR